MGPHFEAGWPSWDDLHLSISSKLWQEGKWMMMMMSQENCAAINGGKS